MAQKRMIDKKISVSEQVSDLGEQGALLFTWMIPHSDDMGLLPYSPRTIKAMVVPMFDSFTTESVWIQLESMRNHGLIEEFIYKNKKYWRLVSFFRSQALKKDRNPQILIDLEVGDNIKENWKKCEEIIGIQMDPNGIQLEPEWKGMERNGIEENGKEEGTGGRKTKLVTAPPSLVSTKENPDQFKAGLRIIERSHARNLAGNIHIPLLTFAATLCATVLVALFYVATPRGYVTKTVAVYEIGQVRAADSTRRAVARSTPSNVSSPVLPEHSEIIALIKKYFGEDWRMAYAICRAESGCRPEAVGDGGLTFVVDGKEYGKSYGVFQIRHLVGRPEPEQLLNAEFNIQYAAAMYRRQGSWWAWSVYTNGSFQKYL